MERLTFLSQDIFGLSKEQIETSNKEIENIYKFNLTDIKEPKFENGEWNYSHFITKNKLINKDYENAIKFVYNLNLIKSLFTIDVTDLYNKCLSLINLLNENDLDNLFIVFNEIKQIILNLLENYNDIKIIVGLFKLTVNLNTYLNLN